MKISKQPKKSVKANQAVGSALPVAPGTNVVGDITSVGMEDCPYTQAKMFIESAINSLTTVASENPIAKESIANLAVVLMDLQSV